LTPVQSPDPSGLGRVGHPRSVGGPWWWLLAPYTATVLTWMASTRDADQGCQTINTTATSSSSVEMPELLAKREYVASLSLASPAPCMAGTTTARLSTNATRYTISEISTHEVVKEMSRSMTPIRPNPNTITASEARLKTLVDRPNAAVCEPLPVRRSRMPTIGRIAIGPMRNTAATTCNTLNTVSMPVVSPRLCRRERLGGIHRPGGGAGWDVKTAPYRRHTGFVPPPWCARRRAGCAIGLW